MTGIKNQIRIALRVLLGLMFFAAGSAKLLGAQPMVDEFSLFAQFGIGQWFRYLTAIIEISGALMLISPKTVPYGAGLIACVCAGAFVSQIMVIHQDWIHALVIGALATWTALGYRKFAAGTAAGATAP